MEHGAGIRRAGQKDHRPRNCINGRELHGIIQLIIGCAAQHGKGLQTSHGGVGLEIDLELSVHMTRCKVAEAHDLRPESLLCDRFQNRPLCQELGMHILVLQLLPEIQGMLVRDISLFQILPVDLGHHAHGRGLYHGCSRLQTELHKILCASQIHILDQISACKMLHHRSTVDDRIDLLILQCHDGRQIRHIPVHDKYAVIHQIQDIGIEVVEIQGYQTLFCFHILSGTEHAVDLALLSRIHQEFMQYMDPEVTGRTREQHISEVMALPVLIVFQRILSKKLIDGGVIIIGDNRILAPLLPSRLL